MIRLWGNRVPGPGALRAARAALTDSALVAEERESLVTRTRPTVLPSSADAGVAKNQAASDTAAARRTVFERRILRLYVKLEILAATKTSSSAPSTDRRESPYCQRREKKRKTRG